MAGEVWREYDAGGRALRLLEAGDGAGALGRRSWRGALEMCALLAGAAGGGGGSVQGGLGGSRVLELGAGAGLAGLFAARHCGPASVTLTERPHGALLSLLRRNAEAHASSSPPSACSHSPPGADHCRDIRVRMLDWRSAPGVDADALALMLSVGNDEREGEVEVESGGAGTPELVLDAQFDVVLASECVYSWEAALTLPCAVRAALAPGGRAVFLHIVREVAVQETLLAGLRGEGLRVAVREGAAGEAAGAGAGADGSGMPGDVGRSGRFLLVLADRADAPAAAWPDPAGPDPAGGLRWLRDSDDLAAAAEGRPPGAGAP